MNAVTAKVTGCRQPLLPSLNHNRPIFSRSLSSLSFKTSYPSPSVSLSYAPIKASSSNPNPNPITPSFPLLRTAAIAAVTATALVFSRFHFFVTPAAIAAAVSPPPVMETQNDSVLDELKEREIEEYLVSNPNDMDALRTLMEIRIKNKKTNEAMSVVDRLLELEPNDVEWSLLKSHLYVSNGEFNSAKNGFYEIISKDPLCVDAYHGLVVAATQEDSSDDLKEIEKRIDEGMKLAKKVKKKTDLRDFKLLIAQIRVIGKNYDDALKVYQELVKEEPRDFRPYLCQGIIYTLLKKNNEAEKNFEKYRRLVPKGHPYARYLDDNMIANKAFAEKLGNERAGLKM